MSEFKANLPRCMTITLIQMVSCCGQAAQLDTKMRLKYKKHSENKKEKACHNAWPATCLATIANHTRTQFNITSFSQISAMLSHADEAEHHDIADTSQTILLGQPGIKMTGRCLHGISVVRIKLILQHARLMGSCKCQGMNGVLLLQLANGINKQV